MEGKAMLYPSLPDQVSFSTHHREPGEHTHEAGQIPIVDDLIKIKFRHFTVPLITNQTLLLELVAKKPFDEIPVLNFYHERMDDLYSLRQVGMPLIRTFKDFPQVEKTFYESDICILDFVSRKKPRSDLSKKCITFEPQGSILEQLEQFKSILEIGKILGREVRVPDLKVADELLHVGQVIEGDFLPSIDLSGARSVFARKIQEAGIIPTKSSNVTFQIYEPLLGLSEAEVRRWFGSCSDNPLVINRADLIFPVAQSDSIKSTLKEVAYEAVREWLNDYTCIDTNRPSKSICKSLSSIPDWAPFYQANCVKPVMEQFSLSGRTYAISDDSLSLNAIIVKSDSSKNLAPVYRRVYLTERLRHSFQDLSWPSLMELSKLVEEEICVMAPRFIGSAYSLASQRIITKREQMGKKSELIGRNKVI